MIEKGVTTKDDCMKMFGEPSFQTNSGGREHWSYRHTEANGVGNALVSFIPIPGTSFLAPDVDIKSNSLSIDFDNEGKVANYSTSKSHQ
jgi:outer membrane protein assembly factor BamE (lipoprotein component of BamABCDE complex)